MAAHRTGRVPLSAGPRSILGKGGEGGLLLGKAREARARRWSEAGWMMHPGRACSQLKGLVAYQHPESCHATRGSHLDATAPSTGRGESRGRPVFGA